MTDLDRNFLLWLTSELHGLFDYSPMSKEHRVIRQAHLTRAYDIIQKVEVEKND